MFQIRSDREFWDSFTIFIKSKSRVLACQILAAFEWERHDWYGAAGICIIFSLKIHFSRLPDKIRVMGSHNREPRGSCWDGVQSNVHPLIPSLGENEDGSKLFLTNISFWICWDAARCTKVEYELWNRLLSAEGKIEFQSEWILFGM